MPKCVVCVQNVSRYDDAIMCSSSSCAKQFHTKCVNISEESLVKLKTSGDIREWKCNSCLSTTNLSTLHEENTVNVDLTSAETCGFDIESFITVKVKHAINLITEEVINILKTEISKLNTNNCHLADEVSKLKNEVTKLNIENSNLKNELHIFTRKRLEDGSTYPQVNKTNIINNPEQKNRPKNDNNKKTKDKDKSGKDNTNANKKDYALVLKDTTKTMSVANSENTPETKKQENNEFLIVQTRKRSNKNKTVTGTAANMQLKAVSKFSYVYVTRLDKDITVDDVKRHLNQINFKEVICDKMNSKHPEIYSSFRVGVPSYRIEQLKNPENWPVGALVNTFFWRMKPETMLS